MNVCINCKHFYDIYCVRKHTKLETNPMWGTKVHDWRVHARDERESFLPWKCGKNGKFFEAAEHPMMKKSL